jgi:hypothetical protein
MELTVWSVCNACTFGLERIVIGMSGHPASETLNRGTPELRADAKRSSGIVRRRALRHNGVVATCLAAGSRSGTEAPLAGARSAALEGDPAGMYH